MCLQFGLDPKWLRVVFDFLLLTLFVVGAAGASAAADTVTRSDKKHISRIYRKRVSTTGGDNDDPKLSIFAFIRERA